MKINAKKTAVILFIIIALYHTMACGCCGGAAGDVNMPKWPSYGDDDDDDTGDDDVPPPTHNPQIEPSIPSQTYQEDSGTHQIDLSLHETDEEDGPENLSWTYVGGDSNMITVEITGKLAYITLQEDAQGSTSVTFVLTDNDGMEARQTVTITIENVNDEPVITSDPVLGATVNGDYRYQVRVDHPDPGDDALIFELTLQPRGLTINSATGLIEWTPDNLQIANHTVRLRVRDSFNSQDNQEWQILVSPYTNASNRSSRDPTEMCMAISDLSMRDQCLINLAVQSADASICAGVRPVRRAECEDEVAGSLTSMCDAISSVYYRDYCYMDLAVQYDNNQYCALISDSGIKQECYDRV